MIMLRMNLPHIVFGRYSINRYRLNLYIGGGHMETLPKEYSGTPVYREAKKILREVEAKMREYNFKYEGEVAEYFALVPFYGFMLTFEGTEQELRRQCQEYLSDDTVEDCPILSLSHLVEVLNGKHDWLDLFGEWLRMWLDHHLAEELSAIPTLRLLAVAFPHTGKIYRGGDNHSWKYSPASYSQSREVALNYAGKSLSLETMPGYPSIRSGNIYWLEPNTYKGVSVLDILKRYHTEHIIFDDLSDEYTWEEEVIVLPTVYQDAKVFKPLVEK